MIIPALIPKSKEDIIRAADIVHGAVSTMQIDVCDGLFVPSISWPYTLGAQHIGEALAPFYESGDGFPYWESLDYEIDLMIQKPADYIEPWILAGAKRLIVHIESFETKDIEGVAPSQAHTIEHFFETLSREHGYTDAENFDFFELGIALNIDTPFDTIAAYIDKFRFIQLMGIRKIGFQGQAFDPAVIEKIKEGRERFPDMPISIDGGVSLANAEALIAAGADSLVAGSAILKSEFPRGAIESFWNIIDA